MPLTCAFSQSVINVQSGMSLVPQLGLVCANATAGAISVTGVELYVTDVVGAPLRGYSGNLPLVPIGVGQTTSVPAASSITIGPFAFAPPPTAASSNSFQGVPPQALPSNPDAVIAPSSFQVFLRARVYGSDGSINEAAPAQFNVFAANQPPLGFQGGFAQFGSQFNSHLLAAVL